MYKLREYKMKKFLSMIISLICLLYLCIFVGCKNDTGTLTNNVMDKDIESENEENENKDDESKEYIEINLTTDDLNIYKSDKFVLLKNVIPNIYESIEYYGYENFIGRRISGYEDNVAILTDAEGLGGVWLGIAPIEDNMRAVEKILDIPDNLRAFAIFPFGYPDEQREQQNRFDENRIHYVK